MQHIGWITITLRSMYLKMKMFTSMDAVDNFGNIFYFP